MSDKFLSLIGLFIFSVLTGSAFGATPLPPCLGLDADCSSNGTGGSYELGDLPFAISWPESPNLVDDVEVSPSSIQSQMASGRRLILAAGDYGDIAITANDVELQIQSGVNIGLINVGGSRIRIIGTPARDHRIRAIWATNTSETDLFLDGLNIVSGDDLDPWDQQNEFRMSRTAILRSYIDMTGHSMYMGAGGFNNIIIAGNYINQHRVHSSDDLASASNTQAGPRIHNVHTGVFVGNRSRNIGKQSFRLHAPHAGGDTFNWVIRGNEFVGSGIQLRPNSGAGAGAQVYDVWLENNDWYHFTNVVIELGDGSSADPYARRVRYNNNRIRSEMGRSLPSAPDGVGWSSSGNESGLTYSDPPGWSYD